MPLTNSYTLAIRATWIGILVNAVIAVLKLVAGLLGHSMALVADALESFSDIGTSLVVWLALNIAQKPADENHPYGHGKAESIGSVVVSMTLIFIAILILWSAGKQFFLGVTVVPSALAFWAAVVSTLGKEALYQYKARLARRIRSSSLMTEAWHHRSDALSSIATIAGIGIAILGGRNWAWVDPAVAMVVGLIIGFMGVRSFVSTSRELMDEQAGADFIQKVRSLAGAEEGILKVEKVRVRKTGLSYLIELHLEVDPLMPVIDSHALGHRVQRLLMNEMEGVAGVMVHIEPFRGKGYPPGA